MKFGATEMYTYNESISMDTSGIILRKHGVTHKGIADNVEINTSTISQQSIKLMRYGHFISSYIVFLDVTMPQLCAPTECTSCLRAYMAASRYSTVQPVNTPSEWLLSPRSLACRRFSLVLAPGGREHVFSLQVRTACPHQPLH